MPWHGNMLAKCNPHGWQIGKPALQKGGSDAGGTRQAEKMWGLPRLGLHPL